jgi:anthranilate synthase/aminodeoxychorismate synthase-like glutamine amidotransferase
MILLIDNHDSFVFNLARYVGELGHEREVVRSDQVTLDGIAARAPSHVILSPGPGTPFDAGISNAVVERFAERIPILGVCLGHLCIGEVFGGRVARAKRPLHGRTSPVAHDGRGVFEGLPNPLRAARYHSLVLDPERVPDALEVSATSDEGEIMAVRHRTLPVVGMQFHPESVLAECGHDLLAGFLRLEART